MTEDPAADKQATTATVETHDTTAGTSESQAGAQPGTGDDGETDRGHRERRRITGRAAIVAAGTLFSRLLGLIREQVLAAMFTRAATDAFFAAFLLPNVLRQLLAEGAVQNGVLPVLTEVRQKHGEERAQDFFRSLRGLSMLVLAVVSVAGVVFAPWLVDLFAGGYRQTPGQYERTVATARWVFPYIFFMGTAALGVAALNTHNRFVVTSFAPALLNIAFIAAALALPTWLAAQGIDPLIALCIGVLFGGMLQVIAQWPSLGKIGYLRLPKLDLRDQHVRVVLRRMAPVLVGFGVYYVDMLVARQLLSRQDMGSMSYFVFAQRLCDFPQGIFVMAVQAATLPSLALLAATNDKQELLRTFGHGLRLALFVAIPATAMYVALANPLVALVFERGHFDAESSRETSRALLAQGAGIWAVAAVRQLVIVFYALGDTRTPVVIAALDFAVFVVAALSLQSVLGHVGISWAVSISSAAQAILLAFYLRRRLGGLQLGRTGRSVLKVLSAALVAAVCSRWLAAAATSWAPDGTLRKLLPGILGCTAFGFVYLTAAVALRSEEVATIVGPLKRRLSR